MPEETLRYKVEIDDASLQSQLASTRTSISSTLNTALSFPSAVYNNVMTDIGVARGVIGGNSAVTMNNMATDMQASRQTFMTSSRPQFAADARMMSQNMGIFTMLGVQAPDNMMTQDMRSAARQELRARTGKVMLETANVATFGLLGPIINRIGQRQESEQVLKIMRAGRPGGAFTDTQLRGLVRDLSTDVAADSRFSTSDLSNLLSTSMATGTFQDVRSVEEFRGKFKQMLENVKSITRVFNETTQEAVYTASALSRLGISDPGNVQGALGQILNLKRMTGMPSQQIMGMATTAAMQTGYTPQVGFNTFLNNAQAAQNLRTMGAINPMTDRMLGGWEGVAQANMATSMALSNSAFANQLIARNLGTDAQSQMEFALNEREIRAGIVGEMPRLMFSKTSAIAKSSGMDQETLIKDIAYRMTGNRAQADAFAKLTMNYDTLASMREGANYRARQELAYERQGEEGKFTSVIGKAWDESMDWISQSAPFRAIGDATGAIASFIGDVGGEIVATPRRFNVGLGKMIRGDVSGVRGQRVVAGIAAGAVIGSVVPVLGTAIGAVIGGVVGGISGIGDIDRFRGNVYGDLTTFADFVKQSNLISYDDSIIASKQVLTKEQESASLVFGALTTSIDSLDEVTQAKMQGMKGRVGRALRGTTFEEQMITLLGGTSTGMEKMSSDKRYATFMKKITAMGVGQQDIEAARALLSEKGVKTPGGLTRYIGDSLQDVTIRTKNDISDSLIIATKRIFRDDTLDPIKKALDDTGAFDQFKQDVVAAFSDDVVGLRGLSGEAYEKKKEELRGKINMWMKLHYSSLANDDSGANVASYTNSILDSMDGARASSSIGAAWQEAAKNVNQLRWYDEVEGVIPEELALSAREGKSEDLKRLVSTKISGVLSGKSTRKGYDVLRAISSEEVTGMMAAGRRRSTLETMRFLTEGTALDDLRLTKDEIKSEMGRASTRLGKDVDRQVMQNLLTAAQSSPEGISTSALVEYIGFKDKENIYGQNMEAGKDGATSVQMVGLMEKLTTSVENLLSSTSALAREIGV